MLLPSFAMLSGTQISLLLLVIITIPLIIILFLIYIVKKLNNIEKKTNK